MAYWLMLGIVSFGLWKMRKRITGFFTVLAVLVVSVSLVFFLTDWFGGGVLRGIPFVNQLFPAYDSFIVDPGESVNSGLKRSEEYISHLNDNLKEEGNRIDEKFGLVKDDNGRWLAFAEGEVTTLQETQNIHVEEPIPDAISSHRRIPFSEIDKVAQNPVFSDSVSSYLSRLTPFSPSILSFEDWTFHINREGVLILDSKGGVWSQ